MGIITDFVESFKHTTFKGIKGGNNSIAVEYELLHSSHEEAMKFWRHPGKKWMHVPILLGRGERAHYISVSIAKNRRRLYLFNSAKRQGRSAVTDDIDIVLDNKTFEHVETGEIRDDSGRYMHLLGVRELQNICDTVVNLSEQCKTNPHSLSWNICIVNSFFHQENDVDCGIFVCFFFDCLSRGINLKTRNNNQGDIGKGLKIGSYREWIAFSCCLNRLHKDASGRSTEHAIEKDGIVHLDGL